MTTIETGVESRPAGPEPGLTQEEVWERTSSYATTTHTPINGVVYSVQDLPKLFGFTYHERKRVMDQQEAARTYCVIGGAALSLDEFEFIHKDNIQLGQE